MGQRRNRANRNTETTNQAASECAGAGHRDLLPDKPSHREFKPIPATRHTQAGHGLDALCEQWIVAEPRNFTWIGAEVKHAAQAFDDQKKPARFRERNTNSQSRSLLIK